MPGPTRRFRFRSSLFCRVGLLLACAALAAAHVESFSFGHQHLAGGHTIHHHHLFCGWHEHPEAQADPDHDDHHGHEREAPPQPSRNDHRSTRRTAAVSPAPLLFQPVGVTLLLTPVTEAAPIAPPRALTPVLRHVRRTSSPRAPPAGERGNPSCRA